MRRKIEGRLDGVVGRPRLLMYDLTNMDWSGFTGRGVSGLDTETAAHVTGRNLLITGAGGSIAAHLATCVAALRPRRLVLMDQAEAGLAQLANALPDELPSEALTFVVGDVCDEALCRELLQEHAIDVVFHAAACKHLPLLETNALAAARTNVLGTQSILSAACSAGVEQFVLLSSDKAVDPISVLGVTKRIAEMVTLLSSATGTTRKVLRLCNVLGSTGSVAPLFAQQIRSGDGVTLTDPAATRYFITAQEAVQCLLRVLAASGSPSLWVPSFAAEHRIESLLQFLQQTVTASMPAATVRQTGLRHGDKLQERLWSEDEVVLSAQDPLLWSLQSAVPSPQILDRGLDRVQQAVAQRDLQQLLDAFRMLVPHYRASDALLASMPVARTHGATR